VVRLSGIVLVDSSGRILLQERDEHAPVDPHLWGFVGGHVEPGESYEEAAYRELAEETGITLNRGDLTLWREFAFKSNGSISTLRVFTAATTLTDASIVVGEGRQIVFVDPATALRLDLSAGAKEAVPAFLSSERYRRLGSRSR
jgi:8-oxo-dGTP pyrophosphatase MutT (NUDIX family)